MQNLATLTDAQIEALSDAELDALLASQPTAKRVPQVGGRVNISPASDFAPREAPGDAPAGMTMGTGRRDTSPIEVEALGSPYGGVPTDTQMASFAYGDSYDRAKDYYDGAERGDLQAELNQKLLGLGIGKGDGGGFGGFKDQMYRNLGVGDELAGSAAYLAQGGENLVRSLRGEEIETPANVAGRAAADANRDAGREYAEKRPMLNAASMAAGIAVTGKPGVGFGRATRVPTVMPATANPVRVGAETAAANAPFALARQEGSLTKRIPGAAAETATAFGLGAAGQQVGNALTNVGANSIATRIVPSPNRLLSREGVNLTPGRMRIPVIGGALKKIEDALTSAPIAGAFVTGAKNRSLREFDRAAYNRVLGEIGETMPGNIDAGRDGVRYVNQRVAEFYDRTLAPVQVAPDAQFQQEFAAALRPDMPQRVIDDLRPLLADVSRRFAGPIDGQTWKALDAELGASVRAASRAAQNDPAQRFLRDGLVEAQVALRNALERADPAAAAAIRQADSAHANLVRVRGAAQGSGAKGGVFSAPQLASAVRAADSTPGHRAFGQGDALMQDLTEAGEAVLPPTVADSGTALRVATGAGIYGGGSTQIGLDKMLMGAAIDGGVGLLYSRPVQAMFNMVYRATDPAQALQTLGRIEALAAQNPALLPYYEQAAAHVRAMGGSAERPVAGPVE